MPFCSAFMPDLPGPGRAFPIGRCIGSGGGIQ